MSLNSVYTLPNRKPYTNPGAISNSGNTSFTNPRSKIYKLNLGILNNYNDIKSIISYNKYAEEICSKFDVIPMHYVNLIGTGKFIHNQDQLDNYLRLHNICKTMIVEYMILNDNYIIGSFQNLKKLHNDSTMPLTLFCNVCTTNNIGRNNVIYFNNTIEELITSTDSIMESELGSTNTILNNLKILKIIETETLKIIENQQYPIYIYKFIKNQEKLKILELSQSFKKYDKYGGYDLKQYCQEKNIVLNWI